MTTLSSYIGNQWYPGETTGVQLVNPVTGETVANACTQGVPIEQAFQIARCDGWTNLQKMTFAERGALLGKMSKAIHGVRESLIEIGRLNGGNTRGDAKFDIDGATGTLMYYAKLGQKLGERHTLIDGQPITIGGARLQGQHILTTKPGVAVHINAFNFPVWGLAEKAACALLAGMPVIAKPATSTAWMTWAAMKAVVEAEILPTGALSLICGSARELLDFVSWGDVIAFTGGAETAEMIRNHPQVLSSGAQVNIEADSLNATVLLENAKEETYDAFIRDVHREMTQKSGQKCTATRRIFVPGKQLDSVIEDLSERLDQTRVGDPQQDGITMGPLSTPAQKEAALRGLETLQAEASIVYGHPTEGSGQTETTTQGAFIHPTLLCLNDGESGDAVHRVEVFGPVATLIPYSGSADDAANGVRKGNGCLVTSVYGDSRPQLKDLIQNLAAWNGRLVITDSKVAEQAYGPGMALPHLLHGGPGRAGGGEELGGVRGMRIYQQRTAIQGNGPLIARLLEIDSE